MAYAPSPSTTLAPQPPNKHFRHISANLCHAHGNGMMDSRARGLSLSGSLLSLTLPWFTPLALTVEYFRAQTPECFIYFTSMTHDTATTTTWVRVVARC